MAEAPTLSEFAQLLTIQSVFRQEQPFKLRGGGMSRSYVDLRAGLCKGPDLRAAASLILNACPSRKLIYNYVGGIGIMGRSLAAAIAYVDGGSLEYSLGNDDTKDDDPLDGYGFHPTVKGRRVFVVDDVGSTGHSITTAVGMIRSEGGTVADGAILVDRSHGQVVDVARQLGVSLRVFFEFDEHNGRIVPAYR